MKIANEIDPIDPQYLDRLLWCVYGSNAFPTMFACKLKYNDRFGDIIWGYSIWKKVPGFRTLGTTLERFFAEHEKPHFFDNQEHALAYMKKLTTPHKSLLQENI